MHIRSLIIALCFTALSLSAGAAQALIEQTKQAQQQQQIHNVERVARFKKTEAEITAQRDALLAQKAQLLEKTQTLSETFSGNENRLAELEEQLRLETGSLGELFGVVRQSAKELDAEMSGSVIAADHSDYQQLLKQIIEAKTLPSMAQLTALWQGMTDQIHASAELKAVSVHFINGEGYQNQIEAYRLGSIGLIGATGYLRWDGSNHVAKPYLKQPDNGPLTTSLTELQQSGLQTVVVDPSRGMMIEQLANSPGLKDRLMQGGVVGEVILVLLAIGLLIALFRGTKLLLVRQQINRQLKRPATPGNNPLGRVLQVYHNEPNRSVEALELRLLEAIVDEQQGLERGLSMLKLLAALAPMLGLLGTVTGMIETFQVITQFGNGDPTVMAGGISMALVTTVLGLTAAMPLLLAHNVISSQADYIRAVLEKQGIGLVAEEAEKQVGHSNAIESV